MNLANSPVLPPLGHQYLLCQYQLSVVWERSLSPHLAMNFSQKCERSFSQLLLLAQVDMGCNPDLYCHLAFPAPWVPTRPKSSSSQSVPPPVSLCSPAFPPGPGPLGSSWAETLAPGAFLPPVLLQPTAFPSGPYPLGSCWAKMLLTPRYILS